MNNTRSYWKDIFTFYSIAILYTWCFGFLIAFKVLPGFFHYLATFGPLLGAFTVLLRNKEQHTLKSLFALKKPFWIFLGGFSPLWITALLLVLLKIFHYPIPNITALGNLNFLGTIGIWAVPIWIVTSGFGEEVGWRGFLLPKLLERYSLFTSSVIIWLFWLVWHLPFFFYIPNYMHMGVGSFIGFAFSLLSGAFLLSWLFISSRKNVTTTILWHGTFNLVTASAFGSGPVAIWLSVGVIISSLFIAKKWFLKGNSKLAFSRLPT